MSIRIFYDEIDLRLKGWRKIKKLVEKVIANENRIWGDLNFILTNDKRIKEINREFLKHNYYTDVISFDNSDCRKISGEIYVSIDTVKRNSLNYKVSYSSELVRVIIHGVLHLCGYRDKNEEERKKMRKQEDLYLTIYEENGNGIHL